jgi:hypothetical protein
MNIPDNDPTYQLLCQIMEPIVEYCKKSDSPDCYLETLTALSSAVAIQLDEGPPGALQCFLSCLMSALEEPKE